MRRGTIIQDTWRRRLAAAALAAALLPALATAGPARARGVPATSTGAISLGLPVSVRYPDMAACRSVPLTNCFRFADGLVVGQPDLLAPVLLLARLFRVPLAGCTRITKVGTSPFLVEVEAAAGFPLAIGSGSCADVRHQLVQHTAYLIAPGTSRVIPPTDGSVLELAGSDLASPSGVVPPGA